MNSYQMLKALCGYHSDYPNSDSENFLNGAALASVWYYEDGWIVRKSEHMVQAELERERDKQDHETMNPDTPTEDKVEVQFE